MSTKGFSGRFTFILIGMAIALSFLFLAGATTGTHIGRYQISTCQKREFVEVYVLDTATGAVKYVDFKDENKPFAEIKSR